MRSKGLGDMTDQQLSLADEEKAMKGGKGGMIAGFVIAAWIAGYTTKPGSGWLRLIAGLVDWVWSQTK